MKFSEVSKFFEKIENINSRNEVALLTAEFFKQCTKQEVQILSYLMLGRIAPLFVNAEFNYSDKGLINLLEAYTGEDISKKRKELGDMGDVVMQIWKKYSEKGSVYTLQQVYEILWKIVNMRGIGSVQSKGETVLVCLKNLSPLESKYFIRLICGELRLGFNARSLLDVYSIYLVKDKGLREILEHAYGVCTDIGYIAGIVVGKNSIKKLSEIEVTPGTPILSRLVERVASLDEVFERIKAPVIVQPKFDGLRCQIHKWVKDDSKAQLSTIWSRYMEQSNPPATLFEEKNSCNIEVRLFTRNLEDVTEMFPEIVASAKAIPPDSFILDSEVMGWDYSKDRFMSYQETMQRRRKYSISEKKANIPVKSFVFDMLFLCGHSFITKSTAVRLDTLYKKFSNIDGSIQLAQSLKISNVNELKRYFKDSISNGLEGIIVKGQGGGYKPGVRNFEWIKAKKSIEKKLVDTIDMVIVGYYYGSGRRAGLGLGAILCAVLNKEKGTMDVICKVGTGLDDDLLREIKKKLEVIKVVDVSFDVRYPKFLQPDIWVKPKYVVTVDADEITKNISRIEGEEDIGGGLSLRFPRLIEFDRDKLLEDITTVGELKSMFKMRKGV